MRKIPRTKLSRRATAYLAKKQAEVNSGKDPESTWKSARQTKTIKDNLINVPTRMAGARARCMFCEDSRGADIDHFWPRARYKSRIFLWKNMLLLCTPCN